MSDKSAIEWTDATWNPVRGCSRVSEGCRNCYAERVAARFSGPGMPYEGLATMRNGEPRWTGAVRVVQKHLLDPLRWTRPRRIFVNSMSDLFHERLSSQEIAAVFAVMALSPQHVFQILTKRSDRLKQWCLGMTEYHRANMGVGFARAIEGIDLPAAMQIPYGWPLPNVWLGVSCEDQATADERVPDLLATPAAVRFVSAEPLLGPVEFVRSLYRREPCPSGCGCEFESDPDALECACDGPCCHSHEWPNGPRIDWVIVGGESGPHARPMNPEWALNIRDECGRAEIAFFFKQWGEWAPMEGSGAGPPTPVAYWRDEDWHYGITSESTAHVVRVGKKRAGRLLDGRTWDEMPS